MIRRLALLAVLLSIPATTASALSSVELKLTAGPEHLSLLAGAGADLDADGDWNAELNYTRVTYSPTSDLGWSQQVFLELNYFAAESLSISGNYTYAVDATDVRTSGPGFSLFYTHFSPGAWSITDPSAAGEGPDPAGSPLPADLFTVGLDGLVLFYQAPAPSSPGLVDSGLASDGTLRLTQFLPAVLADVALAPGLLNLTASASHSFYSDDPVRIASLSDTAATATEAASLDSLMAGLLWTSWSVGTTLTLPYALRLGANYGKQRQVHPDEWVDGLGVSLSGRVLARLRARVAWRRYTSSLGSSDLVTAGLRFLF